VAALDKLYAYEVPTDGRRQVRLRLAWPVIEAIDRDPIGQGLRAFITRRGWDLWTIGGHLELFAGVRAIMIARPERQVWNRIQLATLWGDIGVNERPSGASDMRPTSKPADQPVLEPAG
jgi:hypothetical protein